eukprot:80325_1
MGEGVVLLTGPTRGGKTSLLRAIQANLSGIDNGTDFIHDGIDSSIEAEERVVEMGGGSFVSSCIMLDNKYYTTELQLWRRESDSSVSGSLPCSATIGSRNAPDGLEGVVVVFDLSISCSRGGEWRNEGENESGRHSHLFEAMESGEIASGRSEILLRLCVGTKTDSAIDNDGLFQRRKICMEWCVDNGFEYIEVNCLKPWEGGSTKEKEGIPRVVEALHCCLWSKARLKRRQKKQCGLSLPFPTQNTEPETVVVSTDPPPREKDDDDTSFASSEDIEYRALTDNDDNEETVLPTEGEGSIHNTQTALCMEMQVGSLSSNKAANQQFHESFTMERREHDKEDRRSEDNNNDEVDGLLANDSLGGGSYDDEDGRIAALGKLLSEVQGIRGEAKTLPDHQRRERACEMALKMLDLLDMEDSSSDDSDVDI